MLTPDRKILLRFLPLAACALACFAIPHVAAQISTPVPPTLALPNYTFAKRMNYVQTDAATLSSRGGFFDVVASFSVNTFYTPTAFDAKLEVDSVTYQLAGPQGFTSLALEMAFPTTEAMERTFPTNGWAKIKTSSSAGKFETLYNLPAPPPISPTVVNFDALQNWDGGPVTISWRSPAATLSVQVPLGDPNARPLAFYVYRASSIDLTDAVLLDVRDADIFSHAPVTFNNLQAAPGETLYGELKGFVSSAGWIRFPIRRAPLVAPSAPTITTQPVSQTARAGSSVTLSVAASGAGLSYQWKKNGTAIAGATNATLVLSAIQPADAGSYTVTVTNAGGAVTSDAATLTLLVPPTIATGPASQTVAAGTAVTFNAVVAGTGPFTYQWSRNGTAVAGATSSAFSLGHPRPSDSAQYTVTVTNAAGSVTSSAADLKVNPVSRISNLSILTSLSSAADSFTLGFVLKGADAAGAKPILIRAVGPSLTPLGVQDALADPRLELFDGSTAMMTNDNWGGDAALTNTFTSIGAFAFASATSRDAAVLARVSAASNSIKISGTGNGLVLAELYDATLADDFDVASPRFANVSVLKQIGGGLTAGFVVEGATPLRVLIRGVGPSLAAFGVAGSVADPKLDLFQSGSAAAIASNDNWGTASNAAQVVDAARSVGAFALAADSKDAVLFVTLAPGSYTAQVSGVNNTGGTAIVEVYEVP